jgi:hypothetical protein
MEGKHYGAIPQRRLRQDIVMPLFVIAVLVSAALSGLPAAPVFAAHHEPYFASIETLPRGAGEAQAVQGVVFEDLNRNGRRDPGEPGVAGVLVSNGIEVARTSADGAYRLSLRDDMSVFVIQPSGWRVPTNRDWVPQFAYQHKPQGSPKPLRFGALPPTGPLPEAINFPLIRDAGEDRFACAVLGDIQAYSNQEIGFFRDSTVDDILDRGPGAVDCVLAVGDVMGDDLGLIPRMANIIGTLRVPQWWVHGNHDYDFDADHDRDSADSWRRLWGPAWYAFEMGQVLFIALDNVVYPCGAEDARRPGRDFCVTGERKRYNGRIPDDQMAFVRNLLALTDPAKTVVLATHIPLVSFADNGSVVHQTDNAAELYAMVKGREALSLSGHTHSLENLSPGDSFAGWPGAVGVEAVPFRHIIAGAASGAWYQGDFDVHGVPMALQRFGAPRGWLKLEFDGPSYVETYIGSNVGRERVMWLSFNTPDFRRWFETIDEWRQQDIKARAPVPPLSIHDLPDVKTLTPQDIAEGTFLTANVWAGSTETKVTISINDGPGEAMTRTQQASGEEVRFGAEWADPFAVQRQLSVARIAMQSRSGDPRAQGLELWQGRRFGPAAPQPQGAISDRSPHLWRYRLAPGLPEGAHVATVRVEDRHGRIHEDRIVFEVRSERPEPLWRADVWNAFQDGPPVR